MSVKERKMTELEKRLEKIEKRINQLIQIFNKHRHSYMDNFALYATSDADPQIEKENSGNDN
ncbi:MAG: hypothetical protein ACXAEN_19350 [Candidatus Thorarchaeota archaeon]|jgi:hypothetical protein